MSPKKTSFDCMTVTLWGTRGTIPTCGKHFTKHGGQTTCVEVQSPCLPEGTALVIDGGSGLVPFAMTALTRKIKSLVTLVTHYHWDHIQGLAIAATTYIKTIPKTAIGPEEMEVGPREALEHMMRKPFHPVNFDTVAAGFSFHKLKDPTAQVIVFHPTGGMKIIKIEAFDRAETGPKTVSFGKAGRFPIKECLVVKTLYTNHPERTLMYRFEERPTGRTFVFVTDNENTDGISMNVKRHLENVDLLLMDCQYGEEKYQNGTRGWGHGTPKYCVGVALEVGARALGLIHHDPTHTDNQIDEIYLEAKADLENRLDHWNRPVAPSLAVDKLFTGFDGQVLVVGADPM